MTVSGPEIDASVRAAALKHAIVRASDHLDLDDATMEGAVSAILLGEASPVQIAALAIALRMKGESVGEIVSAARVMRRLSERLPLRSEGVLVDTCGTGGDGSGTFNVSTAAAIVVAASGVRVAKHGNRSVSSRCGSADLLEAMGVVLDAEPERTASDVDDLGIGFLFAPRYHGAMRHAGPVRRELGLRTFFNLLGPLTNPAGASHQLLGIYDGARLRQIAEALMHLGVTAAWVVHGDGGLDEVSIAGTTRVAELKDGSVREFDVSPADFGLRVRPLHEIQGGDAAFNALLLTQVLDGRASAFRDAVVINAAAALVVAGAESDTAIAARRAEEVLDSGAALRLMNAWVERGRASAGRS